MEIADAPTAAAVYFGVLSDHPTRLVCTSEFGDEHDSSPLMHTLTTVPTPSQKLMQASTLQKMKLLD